MAVREPVKRAALIAVSAACAGLLAWALAAGPAGAAQHAAAAPLFAVVNTDGTLARGAGAVSSAQTGVDGEYNVVFNRDVSGCAYEATAGAATAAGVLDDAITLSAAPSLQAGPNGVLVLEYDTILARDSYSSGFDLLVTCPP